ncbi:MAG: hypothetical protein D3909_02965 [Candidatus Electrothrix sp. ATG1]|nr:hypothetical protein [Candidatus Electrothrix sp. ATG1]
MFAAPPQKGEMKVYNDVTRTERDMIRSNCGTPALQRFPNSINTAQIVEFPNTDEIKYVRHVS